jgi:N-carbamoylputrescine amidase
VKSSVTVAAIQCALSEDEKSNTDKISDHVAMAAKKGANVILPSELFQTHYFCTEQSASHFSKARALNDSEIVKHFSALAKTLGVVLPISFFEREGQAYYNSVALIDASGEVLGVYRKSHIPDGPGYSEKYYFSPGNTGFKVWSTSFGKLGVGICWDQWYPECARSMVLQGADLLLYPTAIGSEPGNSHLLATKDAWQRAMVGHAVSNTVPVIAANRVGTEGNQSYYGHSFVADESGSLVGELGPNEEGILLHTLDFEKIRKTRAAWGFFRDRRPDLYGSLLTQDGRTKLPV